MMRESRIYAKEQQIKVIDNILCSLCSLELTSDGRKYLNRMKEKFNRELDRLKEMEEENDQSEIYPSFLGFKFKLPDSLKTPW